MKFTPLITAFLVLACSASNAKSLEKADVSKDIQAILTGFHFLYGDSVWSISQDLSLSTASVFSGSAYCVFAEPATPPVDYTQLAKQIKDGFQRLYDLQASHSGGGIRRSDTVSDNSSEEYFTWTDVHDDARSSKASISFTVHVFPLRDAKLGIVLSYVHVN